MPEIPKFRSQKVLDPIGTAPLPVSAADTGAGEIARGLQQLGAGIGNLGQSIAEQERIRQEIAQKRSDIIDGTSRLQATSLQNASSDKLRPIEGAVLGEQDPTKWQALLDDEFNALSDSLGELNMSPDERDFATVRLQAWKTEQDATLNREVTGKLINTGKATVETALEAAYERNSLEDIAIAEKSFDLMEDELYSNNILAKAKHDEAVERGKDAFNQKTIENFRDSIAVDPLGAKTLLENEQKNRKDGTGIIPEDGLSDSDIQTLITSADNRIDIGQARAEEEQRRILQESTSQTIGEFYKGELTEPELQKRHDAGLIKDSTFESIIKDMRKVAPTESNPFSAREIRRAINNFQAGTISGEQAEEVLLNEYSKLNATDRVNFFEELENVPEKVVTASKSSLYDSGRSLMSPQWADIESDKAFFDLATIKGLTSGEKKIVNRRFTAEVNNRDQYEQAIDEMILRLRKDNRIGDIRKEGTQILLEYQSKREADLLELEQETMKKFQATIPSVAQRRGEVQPVETETLPDDVLQAELERVRARRRELEAR